MVPLELSRGRKKDKPLNIATKNKTIWRIINLIMSNSSFLIFGHVFPDEDCVASLTAFGLLLRKFNKKVCIYLESAIQQPLQFLADLIDYNGIEFYTDVLGPISKPDVIFVLDTPKPDMIAADEYGLQLLADESILKVEIDHHFDADAQTVSMPDFSLLLNASSTCEIIAQICYKLSQRSEILQRYEISELYSRNIVLAMLTGMVGDAKTGGYIFKKSEKKKFDYFFSRLNEILAKKRRRNTTNIANATEILHIIDFLSTSEHKILNKLLDYTTYDDKIAAIFLDKETSAEIFKLGDYSQIVGVVKTATNAIAETAGLIGISVFYDPDDISNKLQYRVRASKAGNYLNLLTVLLDLKIEDGGGHPGAIAFRLNKTNFSDKDFEEFNATLVKKVKKIIAVERGLNE
ncbi:MAG: DHH family phosphoesterase [Treponemataceae bacterium]